ncbi:hypothetical protein TrLO_g10659 [Triparma laevis f. longispina]|uniref:Uncharacterized protein n=1 Tax=Triparma laevis f. longispina TaxID=1714387 RepID=A0A9W7AFQ1_9STRA|nr:hypothetical protein TrLO_g10659 [Triparma laevis f. longispina]
MSSDMPSIWMLIRELKSRGLVKTAGSWLFARVPVFVLLGVELCFVCANMGWKGELFGWAVVSKQSTANS